MFRKHISILCVLLILISMIPMSFAGVITKDDIIVGEIKGKVTNDKVQFLTVSITNPKITESPIWFTLTKVESKLPFAKDIESGLDVSVMSLTSKSAQIEGVAPKRTYTQLNDKYSESYADEIKVINRFFKLKTQWVSLETEMKQISGNLDFASFSTPVKAKEKLSTDDYLKYEKWQTLEREKKAIESELLRVQNQYIKMYENIILVGKIETPSPSKEMGVLESGQYVLRFLDEENHLLKEVRFEVVDKEASLTPVLPLNITK